MNARGVQAQTANQKRVEEFLFEFKRLKRRIQFYENMFNAWDCLPKDSSSGSTRKMLSTNNKSDEYNYKQQTHG